MAEEYKRQGGWRNWTHYIEALPFSKNDTILDLGCGIGTVSKLLSRKASSVIGIDFNHDLIQEAKRINSAENIDYKYGNIENIHGLGLPQADGIWTSFVAAYFPVFTPVLNKWLTLLQPGGWIAIVEMSDLFGHNPLNPNTQRIFKTYSKHQCSKSVYDFEMGVKIKSFLTDCGLSIIHEENKYDRELTFNGPAEPEILKAWENRFNRMNAFKDYLGKNCFLEIKREFLDCLCDQNHVSKTIVKYIIAKI